MLGIYKQYALLVNKIRQGFLWRSQNVTIPNFRNCDVILKHFLKLKYITSFHFNHSEKHFNVILRYDHRNMPVVYSLTLCSSRNRSDTLRLPDMQRLLDSKSVRNVDYLVSTKRGILTIEQAFEQGLGGILLFRIE